MQARSARGTDDTGNEWTTQVASGPLSHTDPSVNVLGHATTSNFICHHDEPKRKNSVLTVISDQTVTEKVERFLESNDVDQYVVDLNIAEDLDSLLDEASWHTKLGKLKKIIRG